jgi:hypothetical protein
VAPYWNEFTGVDGSNELSSTCVPVGVTVTVLVAEGRGVFEGFGWEKTCTVSTIMVFMLEMTKFTMPAVGVPIRAAWLISLIPTAATPHNRLMPSAAATTIHKRDR